ncbi:PDZ domain-containing protein [Megamonas funiformis]|jgi:C-terminal processing protease CtpA/Prc|uniref:PDZ domain-containing protein n=1 Tax=Megamonas funiformis TaxID=437897 RepID=UPI00241FF11D|nr:PDZ domain-containing protein [Megamonas funiformis]
MKKILVLFMLLMTITANCFASSINQEFENTNIEQVKQGIVKAISIFSAKTNLVEKDDNTIVLFNIVDTVDKNNKFMYRDKKDIICELVQKGNNVEMTLSSKYERIYADGTNEVEEYDNVKELKAVLNSVKRVFFDSYVYGIASSREIKDNGVIINVAENSPTAKAGMKTGDCLISINGKSVVDNFEDFNMGQLVDIFSSEPATFVIVQDGTEKTIVVEPDKINAIGVK